MDNLQVLIFALAVPLAIAGLVFWVRMLVDCLRTQSLEGGNRLIWVLVIVFLKFLGAAVYYFAELRPRRANEIGAG